MVADRNEDVNARLVELLSQLLAADDTDALLASFARHEIDKDRIVAEFAARYQRGIGSAVRELAEHDAAAAELVGRRIRDRLDAFLDELGRRDGADERRQPPQQDNLKARDRDDVLLREYVILSAVKRTNEALRSAQLSALVSQVCGETSDSIITAHLQRLLGAGLIGRERKGKYHGVTAGAQHLAALVAEMGARHKRLPIVPPLADA